MASNELNNNRSVAWGWAVATPVLLAVALFGIYCIRMVPGLAGSVYVLVLAPLLILCSGFFALVTPALCLYLDGRSRTHTGAATILLAALAAALLFGRAMAGLFAFVAIATAAAYVLARVKKPFAFGLAGSAAGGVLGAMAFVVILGAGLDKTVGEAWSGEIYRLFNVSYYNMNFWDSWAYTLKQMLQDDQSSGVLLSMLLGGPEQVPVLTEAERAQIILPFLETLVTQSLPGLALAAGLLTGGLAYYLPVLGLQAARKRGAATAGEPVEVPPFSLFKFPRYVVITIFILQFVASLGAEDTGFATLYVAASMLFNVLMTVQALAFLSFLLERKRLGPWLRLVILVPAQALFFWLMPYVGFFDALFEMRTVIARVDALKAKGKQVFTQDGLEELRKMDQSRKKDKNGNDGEDDKQ